MKRPMMIDAIAKRIAAAKVRAISFSIRFPPGLEATSSRSSRGNTNGMALTMRPTGLTSPVDKNWQDFMLVCSSCGR